MKKDSLKKKISADCRKAMLPALIAYSSEGVVSALVGVYTADVLGAFADAVFNLDISFGMTNLWKLVSALVISLVFPALFNMLGEVLMISGAFNHNVLVLGRFLDKKYEDAMSIDEGEAGYRLEWDAIDLRCHWIRIYIKVIVIPVTLIYLLYNVLRVSVPFTVIVFGVSLIKLVVPIAAGKLRAEFDKQTRDYNTRVRSYETEITTRPHVINILALKKAFIGRLDDIYKNYYKDVVGKHLKGLVFARNMSSFLDTFCVLIILFAGAVMVANGAISAGAVAAMVGYFAVFNTLIAGVSRIIQSVPLYNNLVERLKFFYEETENFDGVGIKKVEAIAVDKLSFAYDGKTIFKDVSFKVDKGMKVAVCGVNGSGKSTLIKLLCGLIKGYKGSIKLDDVELSHVAINSWRENFAFAEQDAYLFAGKIKENVWLGNLKATDADVESVMERVGITYLADRDVSASQNELSGGEKQKISIARALLRNTPFLILDEPDNNLDAETLLWLKDFIRSCDRTVIFISHDADVLEVADVRIAL